jgi:hypothetical protein
MEARAADNSTLSLDGAIELTNAKNTKALTQLTENNKLLILSLLASQHPELSTTITQTNAGVNPLHTNFGRATALKDKMQDRFCLGEKTVDAIAHGIANKNLTWASLCSLVSALCVQVNAFGSYSSSPYDKTAEMRQALLKSLLLLRLLIVPLKQQEFPHTDFSNPQSQRYLKRSFNKANFEIIKSMQHPETLKLYMSCCLRLLTMEGIKCRLSNFADAFFSCLNKSAADGDAHEYSNDATDDDNDSVVSSHSSASLQGHNRSMS